MENKGKLILIQTFSSKLNNNNKKNVTYLPCVNIELKIEKGRKQRSITWGSNPWWKLSVCYMPCLLVFI